MSFWSSLVGGGAKEAGEGVKAALGGVGTLLKDARTAITGKDAEAEAKILAALSKVDEAQTEVNKIEASSASFFVAGWRPAVGWVCVLSMGLYYIPRFILGMGFWSMQVWKTGQLVPMPELGISDLIGLLLALLGMSGLRTYEKKEEVAR